MRCRTSHTGLTTNDGSGFLGSGVMTSIAHQAGPQARPSKWWR